MSRARDRVPGSCEHAIFGVCPLPHSHRLRSATLAEVSLLKGKIDAECTITVWCSSRASSAALFHSKLLVDEFYAKATRERESSSS